MTKRNSRFPKKYGQIRFLIRKGPRAAIDVIRSLVRAIVRTNKRRGAIRELMALDDRTLKDIGLHRSQIRSVVEERFNAPAPSPGRSVTLAKMADTRRKAGESAVNDDDFESAADSHFKTGTFCN